MLSSASQRSLRSARCEEKSREGRAERSPFQRRLPAAAEELAVNVPTGGGPHSTQRSPRTPQVVFSSDREVHSSSVSREPRCVDSVTAQARGRRYVLRVEPGARQDNDWMLPPAVARAYEAGAERFAFRSERAGHFQLGRRFPALVGAPELMPGWQSPRRGHQQPPGSAQFSSASAQESGESGGRGPGAKSGGEREAAPPAHFDFARTTESAWRRLRPKHPDVDRRGFVGIGSESSRLICDRRPALFADPYDAALEAERQGATQRKKSLRGEASFITGAASARLSCDFFRPDVDNCIATMRERGRITNERLRERYEEKRDRFRQNRQARLRQSSFQRSLCEKERAARVAAEEEAWRREIAEKEAAAMAISRSNTVHSDLQLAISLGGRRNRSNGGSGH